MKRKLIIQRLKNLFHKIDIHPVTLIYFVLAWIGGYLKWYLSTLLIVCLHEICHLLMAYYFDFEIDKVEILPFGAYLSLNDFYFHPIREEICVVLAGPCSHLLIYVLILVLSSGVYQEYLLTMNMMVFVFNLVPIYPMDGGRIIGLILQSVMDLKKALYLTLKISVFVFCILFCFYCQMNTFVILSYLFIQQFYYLKFIPVYLRKYYTQIPSLYPRDKIVLNRTLTYRRGFHNYYQVDGLIYDEQEMVGELIKNVKK